MVAGAAEFVVGDVTALPWPDDWFVVVTSNDVDCYVEKARPAIEEMHRVLWPGGRIAVEGDHRAIMETAGFAGCPPVASSSGPSSSPPASGREPYIVSGVIRV